MIELNGSNKRSSRNKTIEISKTEINELSKHLLKKTELQSGLSGIFHGDYRDLLPEIKSETIDLLILDPPYNLSKEFNGKRFKKRSLQEYSSWLEQILLALIPKLSSTATVYICGDWFTSLSIFEAANKHFIVRNRISWEREKGRGARANWKNSCEDIWFCTISDTYTFNLDAVKLRRKVIAPYRDKGGNPKDWNDTESGAYRDTHPSNLWTDITIPFWSMAENTEHPTQKSEKLIAKLILASSNPGDLVFDPFAGSGTSAVVAKKLGRRYLASEIEKKYCLLACKRLLMSETENRIQGFAEGVFWERNTLGQQINTASNPAKR